MEEEASSGRNTALCVALITIGGFHYGFNIAIVGAAKQGLVSELSIGVEEFSLLSSAALVGAVIGSPVSGTVCSLFGRRIGTFVGEILSVAGAVGSALSPNFALVVVSRVAIGLGVGFCTLAKPLYVREVLSDERVAPVQASFAPAVAMGILVAEATPALTVNWRVQLALGGAAPLLLLLVALVWMTESPVWLATRAASPAVNSEETDAALLHLPSATSDPLASSTPAHAAVLRPAVEEGVPHVQLARERSRRWQLGAGNCAQLVRWPPMATAALLGLANQFTGACERSLPSISNPTLPSISNPT